MFAINNSTVTSTDNPNQKEVSLNTTPTFVYLYDKEIDPNSIKFCTRIAKISHLQNHVLEFGTAKIPSPQFTITLEQPASNLVTSC